MKRELLKYFAVLRGENAISVALFVQVSIIMLNIQVFQRINFAQMQASVQNAAQ